MSEQPNHHWHRITEHPSRSFVALRCCCCEARAHAVGIETVYGAPVLKFVYGIARAGEFEDKIPPCTPKDPQEPRKFFCTVGSIKAVAL